MNRSFSSKNIEDEFNAIEDEVNNKFAMKDILYPNAKDNLLTRINDFQDQESLINFYNENKEFFRKEHFVQSVVLLWDFARKDKKFCEIPESFLLDMIPFINEMNAIEVSCCYLYLKKLQIESFQETMEALLQKALDSVIAMENVPLSALSRLCIAVGSNTHFHIYLVCKDIIPHIEKYLKDCQTSEDLRLITICLHNLNYLVSEEFLKDYTDKIEKMISNESINSSSVKCIVRILNFLNRIQWSLENTPLIRKLMVLISQNPENLSEKDIETIFRVYQAHMEPSIVGTNILPVAKKILETNPSPSILSYVVQFVPYTERDYLTEIFKTYMRGNISTNVSDLYNYFQILR